MFLWCHVRHNNPVKMHPERIAQNDKNLVMGLDFLCEKKLKQKDSICINVFCYENKLVFPIYNSNQKIENLMSNTIKDHLYKIIQFLNFLFSFFLQLLKVDSFLVTLVFF